MARVALEMGNSPRKIFANYRELIDEHAARAWFVTAPKAASNVIPMAKAVCPARQMTKLSKREQAEEVIRLFQLRKELRGREKVARVLRT